MVAYKNITKIIHVIVAAAVILCILAMVFPEKVTETFGGARMLLQYESELFQTDEIIQIDIQMDEEEWEDMLAHASEEAYYSCDMVINNTKLHNVGIRPKGNTSLSSIVMDPDTDRFSLKIEFDHYVEGQTCFGLDKLILNNNFADATNVKEALVYDMYQYLETDASLYNYAKICVNGEYWGVYLALEAVEDSFLLRNYGAAGGQLYKPESMGMGGGRNREGEGGQKPPAGGNGGFPGGRNPWEVHDQKEGSSAKEESNPSGSTQLPQGENEVDGQEVPDRGRMPGGPAMGGNGADLNYTDDELDSYSTIWEGEVTDSGKNDHRRVVKALKNIKEGTDPEKYMDVDNLLKYMAVHVFSVNLDSLSGIMAHNYYLYEHNGKLNILPWDYNLSFGGMGMGADSGASGVVNDAIDTPFQATEFFDVLLENEEYLARYHEYLRQLVQEYVIGGTFKEFYNRVRNQIDTLVKTDPTAFYSFEEYEAAAEMLYKTVMLRAESIQGQLEGVIPSTDEGQKADSSNLIDASSIDIDTMGVFNRGRHVPNEGEDGFRGLDREDDPYGNQKTESESVVEAFHGEGGMSENEHGFPDMPDLQNMPEGAAWGLNAPGRGEPGISGSGENMVPNMIICGACLLAAVLALLLAKHYQRVKQ